MQLRLGGLTFGGLSLLGSMIGLYGSLTITPAWSSVIESKVARVQQRPFAGAEQLLQGGIAKEQDGEEFLLASETARAIWNCPGLMDKWFRQLSELRTRLDCGTRGLSEVV